MTDLISREALFSEINFKLMNNSNLSIMDVKTIITNAPAIKKDKQVSSFAWALIMETAASFEVASYSISDADAKKSAEGAIKYARDTANKYYTTPQQPQSVADALEEAAKICDDFANSNFGSLVDSGKNGAYVCAKAIRALIKRNAEEGQ